MKENYIRETEMRKRTGLSRTTRWRMEKDGKFPPRYGLSSGISAYKESEYNIWARTRPVTTNRNLASVDSQINPIAGIRDQLVNDFILDKLNPRYFF